MLSGLKDAEIIELKPGAGAFGVINIWYRLEALHDSAGTSYFTSRPWHRPPQTHAPVPQDEKATPAQPTHVLYRSLAYPITDKPLILGRAGDTEQPDVPIDGRTAGVSRRHCTIELQGREVVLNNHSIHATFVDGVRIHKQTVLKLGQIIRLGTPGEQLQLIACVNTK